MILVFIRTTIKTPVEDTTRRKMEGVCGFSTGGRLRSLNNYSPTTFVITPKTVTKPTLGFIKNH